MLAYVDFAQNQVEDFTEQLICKFLVEDQSHFLSDKIFLDKNYGHEEELCVVKSLLYRARTICEFIFKLTLVSEDENLIITCMNFGFIYLFLKFRGSYKRTQRLPWRRRSR